MQALQSKAIQQEQYPYIEAEPLNIPSMSETIGMEFHMNNTA
jgi:hypothetical protein